MKNILKNKIKEEYDLNVFIEKDISYQELIEKSNLTKDDFEKLNFTVNISLKDLLKLQKTRRAYLSTLFLNKQ